MFVKVTAYMRRLSAAAFGAFAGGGVVTVPEGGAGGGVVGAEVTVGLTVGAASASAGTSKPRAVRAARDRRERMARFDTRAPAVGKRPLQGVRAGSVARTGKSVCSRRMSVLRVCVVAAVCGVSARAAAEPADGDVGPVPTAPGDAAEAEGPAAEPVTEGAAPAARLPGVEVTTARRVRHDWYIGVGFGIGAGNLKPAASGAGAVFGGALLGYVRGGGRITDKIAVGGLAVTALGGGNGGARGLTNLMAEGLFFPVKDRGLGIGVALGLSSTYGGRAKAGEMAATVDTPRAGIGFGLGLGYDFWLARRFNLGVWVRGDGSAGPKYGLRAVGTLGLAFSWY